MKKFGATGMKILKTLHLIFVMLWTVGVIAMAILLLMKAQSGDELFMKYKAVRFIDDLIVIPTATITVLIGILYGIKSNWGFFKYKWVTVKWIVSIIVIVVGTFYLSPMLDANLELSDTQRNLAMSNAEMISRENQIFYCGCISSITLILLVIISVFKPWKAKKKV
ncbi:MAG: DUF2269 family protein [Prevotella sp.]|jgi:uncharacterized membrane protein|nr:DUF2269 family protein [Prevotella sp.]